MGLIDDGLDWLDARRKETCGRAVTYSRGAASVALMAMPGRSVAERATEGGVIETIESADWLISAADLVLGGLATVPQAGDRIDDGDAVYEVLPLPGEPAWRYSGPRGVAIRIHSKRVET